MSTNKYLVNFEITKKKLKKHIFDYISLKKYICIRQYKNILGNLLNFSVKVIIFKKNNIYCVISGSNEKYNIPIFLHIIIVKYIYLGKYFEEFLKHNMFDFENGISQGIDTVKCITKRNDFINDHIYIFTHTLKHFCSKINYFNYFNYYKKSNKNNYYEYYIYNSKLYFYFYSGKIDINTIIKLDCFVLFITLLLKSTKIEVLNNFEYSISKNIYNDTIYCGYQVKDYLNNEKIESELTNISQSFLENLFTTYEIIDHIDIVTYYIWLYEKYSNSIHNKFSIIKNKISEIINTSNILNKYEYTEIINNIIKYEKIYGKLTNMYGSRW